ncbi:sensor histidine kinase [Neobacillus sp. M.A.Huq-85]
MLHEEFQQNRRKMIGLAVIFFLMFTYRFFSGSFPKIFLNLLICLTYSVILFIPKSWWTRKKLFLTALILITETAFGVFWFHEMNLIYLISIFIFNVTMQISLSKSSISVVVTMFITALLYIRFGKETIFSILSFIFLTIVLYFTIRLRLQRNEMYRVNQQQLAELQKAYEQLQEASVTSMQYAVLEERTRIARDIHDAIGHSLTSLIVQMQALKFMIKNDPEESQKSLEMMLGVARQGLKDIRTSVHSLADNQEYSGIYPLKALLSRMEATTAIQYTFQSELNTEDLTTSMNGILFKILQEAITNVIRHSQATFVMISLKKVSAVIVMSIRDNGILDSKQKIKEGFGLRGMAERLKERGGRLNYTILEPSGFEILAEIPIDYGENNGVNEG